MHAVTNRHRHHCVPQAAQGVIPWLEYVMCVIIVAIVVANRELRNYCGTIAGKMMRTNEISNHRKLTRIGFDQGYGAVYVPASINK